MIAANPPTFPKPSPATEAQQAPQPDIDPIGQNVNNILEFYGDEERNVTRLQRVAESISDSLAQPLYLVVILLFVLLWIAANVWASRLGFESFDRPPFPWLQGLIGLGSFLTMIMILIKQNRLAKTEERRAHLEMQVNLLAEQKVTKLITLMEELRHDLPIKDRDDPETAAYQQPTDPKSVLAAIDERFETGQP